MEPTLNFIPDVDIPNIPSHHIPPREYAEKDNTIERILLLKQITPSQPSCTSLPFLLSKTKPQTWTLTTNSWIIRPVMINNHYPLLKSPDLLNSSPTSQFFQPTTIPTKYHLDHRHRKDPGKLTIIYYLDDILQCSRQWTTLMDVGITTKPSRWKMDQILNREDRWCPIFANISEGRHVECSLF